MSDNHPGCFGSSLCCQPAGIPCSSCPFLGECKPEAEARSKRLRDKFGLNAFRPTTTNGVSTVVYRRQGGKPPMPDMPKDHPGGAGAALVACGDGGTVIAPNKKAAELLDRLTRRGVDLKREIASGRNPFTFEPPAFMRVAVNMLHSQGIERGPLREALKAELGWGDTSAASHVGIVLSALQASGAVQAGAGGILRPMEMVV